MQAYRLIIDGYNLLYAAGWGRQQYGPGDLQRARLRLLRWLIQTLSPAEVKFTLVVFDAQSPPPDRSPQQWFRGLSVMFANPEGEADPVIERLIEEHSAPRRLTVVSSDHRLQKAARRRRSQAQDSERFLASLARRAPDTPVEPDEPPEKTSGELSALEVAYWLKQFPVDQPGLPVETPTNEQRQPPASTPREHPQSTGAPPNQAGSSSSPPLRRSQQKAKIHKMLTSLSSDAPPFSAEWLAELQRWVNQQQ